MKTKLAIAAALFALAVFATGAVVIASSDDTPQRPPWENEDGTMDVTKLPATRTVVDLTGAIVGTISTDYMVSGDRPTELPVTGPDGQLVGHIGPNGFWALGEPEPVREGAYTVIEEFDESGELIGTRTINH